MKLLLRRDQQIFCLASPLNVLKLNGLKLSAGRLPRLDARMPSRADRFDTAYLRAAQAYMLISMPTGTSTILGVFQVILFSQAVCSQVVWREHHAGAEPKSTPDATQVRRIEGRTPISLLDKAASLLDKALGR
jgi:hypothetical protein